MQTAPARAREFIDVGDHDRYFAAETDPKKQRDDMRAYEKHTLDTMVHAIVLPYWYRIVPMRSYVKGWKISPSHYLNQDLADIWLEK